MKYFEWDLGFVLPIHFVEIFLANGVLFESEHSNVISKDKHTALSISNKCYEVLDDMIKQYSCFKNQGFSGNQVASMIVYTARQEVLNLSRSRHIWPKELQLLSRQTDKQVKKLAGIYKQGSRVNRIEPYEDNSNLAGNHEGANKSSRYLDLTKPPSSYETGLISPRATTLHHEHLVSCEKNGNQPTDVPVA